MMAKTTTAACLLAAAVATFVAAAGDAAHPSAQARFKSGVDLVPLDASVIGRDGRPIENLTAADFALTVDGKPRRIASAEYIRLSPRSAPGPPATHYSTNANADGARLVMLIVDEGNIAAGRVRAASESAIRFIKRLSPADGLALYAIPGPGPQISFTSNHALVQAQLPRIAGQATAAAGPPRLGLGESSRIERGDALALSAAADRECAAADRLLCQQELEAHAREIMGDARSRARTSIAALRALMQQLSTTSAPKTVVLLSESLVIDQEPSLLSWVGPLAAKGRVSLHVLRIEASGADAGLDRRSANRGDDAAVAEEGLALLAGLARGSLFRVVGNADAIFSRVALEMSGYYLLGFEPGPGDRVGQPHKIKLTVPGRRDVQVRAREDFEVEPPRLQASEDALAETLRGPLPATDIGLKVTTYTFREASSEKLRILVAAEIDRGKNPTGQIALGYALLNDRGAIVASRFEPRLQAPVLAGRMLQRFVTAVAADAPGLYALKLAVVDDTGRRGSVEHGFTAQLTAAGPIRAGDFVIGEEGGAAADGATPAVAAEFTDPDELHGYLELYGESAEALTGASVLLEVASREDSRALLSAPARIGDTAAGGSRRVVEGVVGIGVLPPGEYHARAVVRVDGRRSAQVVRPFRIVRGTSIAAGRGRPRARSTAPISFRVEPFQRATVLTPQVVGFFMDRMGAGNRAAVPPDVVEHARAGRFDAALEATRRGDHPLAAAFLQGMTLYARGDMEAAAIKFRESLRIDSEFFPAAFYLGACYAAGGREREAAAAWQTSLVTEGDAPFVYTLLGDSLLRQREIDAALEILNEANARWPGDAQVQTRLAAALAMAGKSADALQVLDAYLAEQPADAERLFLALRVIYDAHASGGTIAGLTEDRMRFDRYAAAYAAAKGPQLALVEEWRKVVGGR